MITTLQELAQLYNAKQSGSGKYLACCPAHQDASASLSLFEVDGKICVHCFAGCPSEDVIQAMLASGDVSGELFYGKEQDQKRRQLDKIRGSETDLLGTPAESYLASRGLNPQAWPASVRHVIKYVPPSEDHGRPFPAMLALAQGPAGGIKGGQLCFITEQGHKIKTGPARKSVGNLSQAFVVIPGSDKIVIAEGVEDALSIYEATGYQVISSLGLGRIEKMALGAGMTVVLARDLDPEGSPADRKFKNVCKTLSKRGVDLYIATPDQLGDSEKADFNDILKTSGKARVKELIDSAINYKDLQLQQVTGDHDKKDIVARFNSRYFVVKDHGKTVVMEEKEDPVLKRTSLIRLSFADFKNYYSNKHTLVFDQAGNAKELDIGSFWLRDSGRRQYEHVVFYPNKEALPDYNLWRGWGVSLKHSGVGSWDLLKEHILDNICHGIKADYEYILNWMARGVQKLDKQGEVAIVLRGKRGNGKGTFASAYGKIFGQHFLHVSQARHVTGNFNSHLRDCLVLFADEAFWAGDKQGESVLKTLISEDTLTIEQKGKDVVTEKNRIKLIIASNSDWVVPAGLEERRFAVFEVSDKHLQDHNYFKLIKDQLEDGGYSAMLEELLSRDISQFNVRLMPKTKALFEQKLHSMQPVEKWWFEKLWHGKLLESDSDWNGEITSGDLYQDYCKTLTNLGQTRKSLETELAVKLKKMLSPEWPAVKREYRRDSSGMQQKTRVYVLPEIETCRKFFNVHLGQTIDWPKLEADSQQGPKVVHISATSGLEPPL